MNRPIAAAVVTAALALAGCASTGHPGPAVTVTRTVTASPSVKPSPLKTAQPVPSGNMELAPGNLAPGPFRITALHCGPFSAAQRARFGTSARGGLVYRYVNVSNDVDGSAVADATFLDHGAASGENVAAMPPVIAPGQSAVWGVDATAGGSNEDLTFTSCLLNSYDVLVTSGNESGPFAP